MAEKTDQKSDDDKKGGSKRLTREEYDRLVRGTDDIFFGGEDESEGDKKPLPENPASEAKKNEDGGK